MVKRVKYVRLIIFSVCLNTYVTDAHIARPFWILKAQVRFELNATGKLCFVIDPFVTPSSQCKPVTSRWRTG